MTNNSWQGREGLKVEGNKKKLSTVSAIVMDSKIYLIHGYKIGEERNPNWVDKPYVVHCFGPKYNVWKKLASTSHSHFESSIFVVNNRLCGMGGGGSSWPCTCGRVK